MKFRLALAAALLLGSAGLQAQELDIEALAGQSGLSERQVRMVLGAPVAFAEYRSSYRDSRDRLRRAVGGRGELARLTALYAEQQEALVAVR